MQPFEYRDTIIMLSEIKEDNITINRQIKVVEELSKTDSYRHTKLHELEFLKESNKALYNTLKFNLN